MNRLIPIVILLIGGVAWPLPLRAQEKLEVRIIPRFGLLAPDSYFFEEFANFSGDGPVEWTTGSLGRAAFAGVGVEVGSGNRGFFLRGELTRSFQGWLSAVHGLLIPRVLFEPPQVVNTWLDVPAAITFLSLQAVLQTRLTIRRVQPYVLAGFAGKWYSFGSPTEPNTVEAILPSDGYTPALELGGGLTFKVLGLTFDAQAKDVVNRYWGKTQHDLVFSGGLVWSVR